MPDKKNEMDAVLHETMLLYVERLRDPDVVAATDARGAASVVKMLLEKCVEGEPPGNEPDREECAGEQLSRREILELLQRISKQQAATDT